MDQRGPHDTGVFLAGHYPLVGLPDAFVIWNLDCASSHLEPPFLAFARACGFHLVIVPTHTTFLLQVLDVFFFRRFKAALRRLFRHMQTVMNVVRLRVESYLQLVYEAAQIAFEGMLDLPALFAKLGFGDMQAGVHALIPRFLEAPVVPAPALEPTDEQLRRILPRGRGIPGAALRGAGPLALPGPPGPAPLPAPAHVPEPLPPAENVPPEAERRVLVFRRRAPPDAAPPAPDPSAPESPAGPAAEGLPSESSAGPLLAEEPWQQPPVERPRPPRLRLQGVPRLQGPPPTEPAGASWTAPGSSST